jgi:hypothetical protein
MTSLNHNGIYYTVAFNHWLPKRLGHDAFTWNGVIRVADSVVLPADLHCHEWQHIRQEHELGKLHFWFAYLWELRHGYHGNRFEAEAYGIQADPAQVATFSEVRA